jgi:hypothetical protein
MEDPIEKNHPREQDRDGFTLPRPDFLGPKLALVDIILLIYRGSFCVFGFSKLAFQI